MSASGVRDLPGGLHLRPGRPGDLEQVGELLARRGEEHDALDHRLVVEDPEAGWESCAVVVDGDRVVSTATLLDETVRVGTEWLPAGQVELVATDEAYEDRGLVRALMAWAHERSAARGHVLQVMIGIPYFYRLFGYEYAIDIPAARRVEVPAPTAGAPVTIARPAGPGDLPALARLQDAAQAAVDVAMPHPAARRRWLLEHSASTTWVVEREGTVVASARVRRDDGELLAAEAAAVDEPAAHALLDHLARLAEGSSPLLVDRPGAVTAVAAGVRDEQRDAEQYYVRVPDVAELLDRLRPVLGQRLLASGLDRAGGDVLVSTFRRHYRMAVGEDGLGAPLTGGRLQAPGALGGMAVPPDYVGALALGPLGVAGLARRRPDVYPGPDRDLYEALFPPLTSDLLTYYLPY